MIRNTTPRRRRNRNPLVAEMIRKSIQASPSQTYQVITPVGALLFEIGKGVMNAWVQETRTIRHNETTGEQAVKLVMRGLLEPIKKEMDNIQYVIS